MTFHIDLCTTHEKVCKRRESLAISILVWQPPDFGSGTFDACGEFNSLHGVLAYGYRGMLLKRLVHPSSCTILQMDSDSGVRCITSIHGANKAASVER